MKNVILVGLVAFSLVACGAKEEAVVEEAAPVAEEVTVVEEAPAVEETGGVPVDVSESADEVVEQ